MSRIPAPDSIKNTGKIIKIDPKGNILALGENQQNIFIIKYNSKGQILWYHNFPYFKAFDMLVDDSNNIILSIAFDPLHAISDPGNGPAIVKVNTEGIKLWEKRIKDNYAVSHFHIVCDKMQNIFLCPDYDSGIKINDYFLKATKLNKDGDSLWTRPFSDYYSLPYDHKLTVDRVGNIYLSSVTSQDFTNNSTENVSLMKLNGNAKKLWSKTFFKKESAGNIQVDMKNNIYLPLALTDENWLIKLNETGDSIWRQQYESPVQYTDSQIIGHAVVQTFLSIPEVYTIDAESNIYLITQTLDNAQNTIVLLYKFSSAGLQIYKDTLKAQQGHFIYFDYSLGLNKNNNLYGGFSQINNYPFRSGVFDSDFLLVQYNSVTGSEIANSVFNSSAIDIPYQMCIDSLGNQYMIGTSINKENNSADMIVIKYSENTMGIEDFVTKQNMGDLAIFPNPADNYLHIKRPGNFCDQLKIEIFDLAGKMVFSENISSSSENVNASINIQNLSSGLYFIKLQDHQQINTAKFEVKH